MIALLDLNYTFVANSLELKHRSIAYRYQNEKYRTWLLDVFKGLGIDTVVLITVRGVEFQERTLVRIAEQCSGWQPDMPVFNWTKLDPPAFKKLAMEQRVFPQLGADPSQYIAFESNVDTWRVYTAMGIRGFKVFEQEQGDADDYRRPRSRGLF